MERRWHFLALLFFGLVGCGQGKQDLSQVNGQENPRDYWHSRAPSCAGFPSKADCTDGDMVLFGGLLCASGEASGCDLVRRSQDGDGRWWRSPRRNPGNLGEGASFSRDMAMGVMLYLVTTHDTNAASRWLDWIENNRPCITPKPGGGCWLRGAHRYCTDEDNHACTLTPGSWALMARVWDNLGLGRSSEMDNMASSDEDALWQQAQNAPLGYETHLPAVEVLLKQRINASPSSREKAAGILARRQPDNPFFVFLRDGATQDGRDRVLSICPRQDHDSSTMHQWAWERPTVDEAWNDSMDWDCIFMANLLGMPFNG